MKHFYKGLVLAALLVWTGCSDETVVYEDGLKTDLYVETNAAALKSAISYDKSGVLKVIPPGVGMPEGTMAMAGDYPLTLIATVNPPSFPGEEPLTATHADLDGDYVFVGYNKAGDVYQGAIDVIDISDPNIPQVRSRLFYSNADINSLAFSNGYIYAVGAINAETSDIATGNSFIARIPVSFGVFDTEKIIYGFQQGFNANDVLVDGSRAIVTSGKQGVVAAYNTSDLAIAEEMYVEDARSLTTWLDGYAVLDAGSGVRLLNAALTETSLIPIGTDLGETSKKTLGIWENKILVPEAAQGAGIYNGTSGTLLQYVAIPTIPSEVSPDQAVTNAVSVNDDLLFMANGGAGLALAELLASTITTAGTINLDGSVNYVISKDDYAFVASGSDGLQIIQLNRPPKTLLNACSDLSSYDGSSILNVGFGESLAFQGGKQLDQINDEGFLILCGSWTVSQHVDIAPDAVLRLFGTLAIGTNADKGSLTVSAGSLLQIEGNVTIYGDLILEDGAQVEFIGNSIIDIFGDVSAGREATVSGTFRDVRNKFSN
ncbi:hypothetical protein [Robiginitalea aurantiaca]|uniref:LVIVD repeat-containing protein n=1 Tax=Robiginitalea aurantiaca TaxID=3056915 RepID=A0ABT7WFH7_9FLAO|nr:hypothetical protein [Robiginitalea aurantiaca]MDM9631666.1 hypothetical protein [Robiginitalea aurantiaca]